MTAPTLNFTAVDLELAIAKLEMAPSDILVVKIDAILDGHTLNRIHASVRAQRRDGGNVLVIDRTTDISVLKAVDDEPSDADDEESGG